MIKEVKIRSLKGIKDLILEQDRNPDNKRYRSSFFYRGMPDESFKLTTSLDRNCKGKTELEGYLLDNFKKYARIEDPLIDKSIWRAMIVGQHHGLPTRLLDWTHSPLVALHFANDITNYDEFGKKDCVVWRIDAKELNCLLPNKYTESLQKKNTFIFSVEHLSELAKDISQYDEDMNGKAFVTVEPPSIDQRIVNQYSFFTIIPKGLKDMEDILAKTNNTVKYIIDKKLRWDLRDILDQLNMNERIIYPGIDGIAKWLGRHYYVK